MKRLMLAHAFRLVNTVVFYVGERNIRSQRAVEKLGASRTGLGRDDGSGRPSIRYELSREQFEGGTNVAAARPG